MFPRRKRLTKKQKNDRGRITRGDVRKMEQKSHGPSRAEKRARAERAWRLADRRPCPDCGAPVYSEPTTGVVLDGKTRGALHVRVCEFLARASTPAELAAIRATQKPPEPVAACVASGACPDCDRLASRCVC